MNADRNLLFGILAFQNNFIDRQALLGAFDRWTTDKNKPLGEILVEDKAISADEYALLEALVRKHLDRYGGIPEKSLAAIIPVDSVRDNLKRLDDPDVAASLVHVSIAPVARTLDATLTWTAGSPTLAGSRFRVLRPHAKGGLGEVFVAHDEELDREVAFKEIQNQHADNPDSRGRFLLEAKVTGGLEHPGIVPIYGLGHYADGRPFYAMRFIKGDTFKEAIKRFHQANSGGSGPTERTAELRKLLGRFVDVCNAIEYAHNRGVLHRDLKPGNIMLGNYGETLVVDWGLAKVMGKSETPSTTNESAMKPLLSSGSAATQMGQAIGTPQYMSPEQAAGRWDELGPASDVYSLGATLYTLLTGHEPISDSESMDVLARVVKGDFLAPRTIDKEVPLALEAICLKAMALKPADRYPSSRSLADDIERWLNDQPVSVLRDPVMRRFARWVRNHKGTAGAAAAAAVVLVIAGLIGSALSKRANDQTRALAVAESVLTARADGVPYTLEYLRPIGRHALVRLREHLNDQQADPVQRLRAACALADLGEAPQEFLMKAVSTAPAVECRNLIAALEHVKESALPELVRRLESAAEAATRARFAIIALQLGDPKPAQQALTLRSDPINRTALIHGFAAWHGDAAYAAELLTATDDPTLRSGLCAAMGTITPTSSEREAAVKTLTELYTKAPDGGTHSAAGWALRQWKQDLPMIAPTSRPPSDRGWFVNGQGMTMVVVAAGKSTMGTAGEHGNPVEQPAHDVTLTRAYYLGDREVTVAQFQRFIKDAEYPAAEKPQRWPEAFQESNQSNSKDDHPATNVNWFDAVLYCNWLSTQEGRKLCYERTGEKQKVQDVQQKTEQMWDDWRCDFAANGYRLPTEAEWEYAARAGSSEWFCYGHDEDLLSQYASFVENAKSRTWPGGAKLPNASGLFDMHGGVCEWCWDWRGSYPSKAVSDPTGPAAGSGRVLRGGAFVASASSCRSATREENLPTYRAADYGIRVSCGR